MKTVAAVIAVIDRKTDVFRTIEDAKPDTKCAV